MVWPPGSKVSGTPSGLSRTRSAGPGPVDDLDYCLPVGKAAIRRTGSEVTVISYLAMVQYVLQAVETVGTVDAEVIDLRWLDRASIDWDTIGASIEKTKPSGASRRQRNQYPASRWRRRYISSAQLFFKRDLRCLAI